MLHWNHFQYLEIYKLPIKKSIYEKMSGGEKWNSNFLEKRKNEIQIF